MTLPANGAISMSQIANEVGLALPISINHPWFLVLINKAGFPISFSDFYSKTGRFDGSIAGGGSNPSFGTIQFGGAPFFGATLNLASTFSGASGNIIFNSAPLWNGNLFLKNNTTGISGVFHPLGGGTNQWSIVSAPANLIRGTFTDNYTLLPST